MKRVNTRLLIAEVVLLLASVLVFRSLWLLIDTLPVMHEEWVLWLSLLFAIVITIPAMRYLIRHSR